MNSAILICKNRYAREEKGISCLIKVGECLSLERSKRENGRECQRESITYVILCQRGKLWWSWYSTTGSFDIIWVSRFFFFWDFWEIFQLTFKRVVNKSERFTCWKKNYSVCLFRRKPFWETQNVQKFESYLICKPSFFLMEYHLNHLSFYKYFESVKVIPTDIV